LVNVSADDNQAFLTALLFMRGLSGFQGAILMTERGMTQEARTLARGCFETVFYLGALRKDSAFAGALVRDDASRKKKLANAILKSSDDPLESDLTGKLENFLVRLAQTGLATESISIEGVAKLAGLAELYDTYYRGLSGDAAHPSVTSLNHHVEADEKRVIQGLRWGPDVSNVTVEDTLMVAVTAVVHLIFLAKEILDRDDVAEGLDRCWEEYKRLIDEKAKKKHSTG
jgi:hypothetical protein